MSRARVGISGVTRLVNGNAQSGVNTAYVAAVLAAGGLPVLLLPELSTEETLELFGECDALLLTGGEDVEPARYGAAPHPKLGGVDPRRDRNELALVAEARARTLPILAICRGIQLVNVAYGGTLIQDLPSERPGGVDHDPGSDRSGTAHDIRLVPGSRLHGIVGADALPVNSFHHQAADRIGEGLIATAHADDGVIEGLESTVPNEWVVCVQWHPEERTAARGALDPALFAALLTAARRA